MTNEEILANAPEGATHIEMLAGTVPYYLRHEITGTSNYHYYGRDNVWSAIKSGPSGKIRSLSDIRRIVELESELKASATACEMLHRDKEAAERERDRLKEYSYEQALLPSASFNGVRELVNDIQKDATDVGGCYEVSTGHLDALFEAFTDSRACKLLNKFAIEQKIKGIYGATNYVADNNDISYLPNDFILELCEKYAEQLRQQLSGDDQ